MASNAWTRIGFIAAIVAVLSVANGVFAQEGDLQEAKSLYDRGQADAGLAKLQEIVGSGPDQDQAFALASFYLSAKHLVLCAGS